MDNEALIEEAVEHLPLIGKLSHLAVSRDLPMVDLTLGQMRTLGFLYHHGRATVGEVAGAVGVAMPTASELIDRLVERGLIEREVNPANRRQVHVWLSEEARAYGRRLHEARREQVRATLAKLEPEERPVFFKSLRVLVETLREASGASSFELRTSRRRTDDDAAARDESTGE